MFGIPCLHRGSGPTGKQGLSEGAVGGTGKDQTLFHECDPPVQPLVCKLLVILSTPSLFICIWTKHKVSPSPLYVRSHQLRPGTLHTQGGMDQRSCTVCRDLTDPSASSPCAWAVGHGVEVSRMLWWEGLHGGSWSRLRGQRGAAGAADRHRPPLRQDGARER